MYQNNNNLSLYIHMPWCIKKCPYCDFNSYAFKNSIPEKEYITKLLLDLEQDLTLIKNRNIKSIYFGGGTPSLFSAKSFSELLEKIQKKLSFSHDIEITMEANPGSLEYKDFKDYKAAGINRVSLGAQTFSNTMLNTLGRVHSSKDIYKAIENLNNSGIDNYNIDIMYGLPGQSLNEAMHDLKQALILNPSHLSWYNLTIEPNTYFYKHPPKLPNEDLIFKIMQEGKSLLNKSDIICYEVSAYSKRDSYKSVHNLNYWEFGDYIGIGAGAHGKLTSNDKVLRTWKTRNPNDYLKRNSDFCAGTRTLNKSELIFEFMLNALRLDKGFSLELFKTTTNLNLEDIQNKINITLDKGLINFSNNHIMPTELGKKYLNNLCEIFLS